MQNLIGTFKKIGNISEDNETALMSGIRKVEYAPRTILQEQGKISNKIFFVEKGIARTFYYKDGKDITYWIAMENDFVGSMSSYFMREASNKIVETIEDCQLWEFEFQKLENLFSTNKDLEKIGRLFASYGISLMEKRFDNLHFHTAKERYDLLITQQPDILLRMPLGMVATYLGITQETLSRIRSQK